MVTTENPQPYQPSDTVLELQEVEREYTKAKNDYHECLSFMKRLHKKSEGYKYHRERMPEIHARLAELKARVNILRTLAGAERQAQNLAALGGGGSLSGAMRALTRRAGKIEQVYYLACMFTDDPSEKNLNMLKAAVKKARGNEEG